MGNVYRPKRRRIETKPLGAAYTYIAYIGGYPPGPYCSYVPLALSYYIPLLVTRIFTVFSSFVSTTHRT